MSDFTPPITPELADPTEQKTGPSNLRLRVIYASIGAAMLLGSVWYSAWTFALFFAAVQTKMLLEFYRMMRADGFKPAKWIGVGTSLITTAGLVFMVAANEEGTLGTVPAVAIALFLCLPVFLLLRAIVLWPTHNKPFSDLAATLAGLFYVSFPMILLGVIANFHSAYDYRRVFALLFLVWASDIGAYAAGKTFGKHKLAPSISPGKTWEGWAGGFLLTLAVGWALKFMLPDVPLEHRLVAAGVVAIFGPLGDLAESMLKRSVGVKDSGSIMPGHGGLLDRFDAFLLVLPVLALLQLLAG
ncbi:phosphatidate cytidylyltransferase [Hymenobacter sp. BT683]|uniref:Phosphatidate cytidylyltransferase n=1 Tax=Hymenobacter jeongseonensis TaxID=2791027 RepID=A0ABS0IL19_9BACT|nr:phosphatidate cytidylyltransferase [Hymenobacter jeongseonensis]MBF9239036.1 phosphatidate cytidylyltransferase [Hymenobacter jeongseonensis]